MHHITMPPGSSMRRSTRRQSAARGYQDLIGRNRALSTVRRVEAARNAPAELFSWGVMSSEGVSSPCNARLVGSVMSRLGLTLAPARPLPDRLELRPENRKPDRGRDRGAHARLLTRTMEIGQHGSRPGERARPCEPVCDRSGTQ